MVAPNDSVLENEVIGWMMDFGSGQLDRVANRLTPEDFYGPTNARVFGEIITRFQRGDPTSLVALLDKFDRIDLQGYGEANQLAAPEAACDRLVGLAQDRSVVTALSHAQLAMDDGSPTDEIAAEAIEALADATHRTTGEPTAVHFSEVEGWQEKASPWLLDGMMRRRHRAILVAPEGAGKSFLLKQIGLMAAAGLHPFRAGKTLKNGPVKTLIIDLENPRDQIAETTRWIMNAIRAELPHLKTSHPDDFPAWSVDWPGRIDLRSRSGRAQVEREIRKTRPDLVILGPLYRAYKRTGRESDEEVASEVTEILDDYRVRYDLTMLFEHHAPHAVGSSKRKMRPVGSSLWQRWPEFGLGLEKVKTADGAPAKFKLNRFRGDRVATQWPEYVEHSDRLPWTGIYATGTLRDPKGKF